MTELTWLREESPEEVRQFWGEAYPAMRGVEENLTSVRHLGYEPVASFVLPEEDWWNDYYEPLEARVRELEAQPDPNDAQAQVAAMTRAEIELYRAHSASYGYVSYVMRRDH